MNNDNKQECPYTADHQDAGDSHDVSVAQDRRDVKDDTYDEGVEEDAHITDQENGHGRDATDAAVSMRQDISWPSNESRQSKSSPSHSTAGNHSESSSKKSSKSSSKSAIEMVNVRKNGKTQQVPRSSLGPSTVKREKVARGWEKLSS